MSPSHLGADLPMAMSVLTPHAVAVGLCAARLLPVAFLCPLLGGPLAPMPVRLGLVLSLALGLHVEGGVQAPESALGTLFGLGAETLRELGLGTSLGLVAALPLDAARMGGRFLDLFRGASAEAALPFLGARESASGNLLYQLALACLCVGPLAPWVLAPLWRSFATVPLGTALAQEGGALEVAILVTRAMSTGLAVGAPFAGLSLALDGLFALAARAAPQLRLQDASAPLKLLGGAAVLWLALELLTGRLLRDAGSSGGDLLRVLELSR